MDQSTIDGILVEIASDKKDRIMAGITQEWMQEGLEKGYNRRNDKVINHPFGANALALFLMT